MTAEVDRLAELGAELDECRDPVEEETLMIMIAELAGRLDERKGLGS